MMSNIILLVVAAVRPVLMLPFDLLETISSIGLTLIMDTTPLKEDAAVLPKEGIELDEESDLLMSLHALVKEAALSRSLQTLLKERLPAFPLLDGNVFNKESTRSSSCLHALSLFFLLSDAAVD